LKSTITEEELRSKKNKGWKKIKKKNENET
jgi:hypothetical protein